jgi:hypothetical protein
MSDAPERIWAWTRQSNLSPDHVRMDSVWVKHPHAKDTNASEYVLASRLAEVEAERDAALRQRDNSNEGYCQAVTRADALQREVDAVKPLVAAIEDMRLGSIGVSLKVHEALRAYRCAALETRSEQGEG